MTMPPLPEPDTHCWDEDTSKDVWSHSPDQMRAYGEACATSYKADAERYRWLKAQPGLRLESDAMLWTRIDGTKFVSTHRLSAGGTQYGPAETLDTTIDAAIRAQGETP